MLVSFTGAKPVYYELVIVAASAATEIWLGDDGGHFVQKEIGTIRTSLLAGHYTVEFGLGSPLYPIHLAKASRYTQAELAAGPTCSRPILKLAL
jgi:hypothetical protein